MVAMCQPERGPLRFYLSYFFFDSAPPTSQVSHFTAEGVGVFRLPFGWQYMQSNGLGTTINAGFFSEYNALVQAVISAGAIPILDLHKYVPLQYTCHCSFETKPSLTLATATLAGMAELSAKADLPTLISRMFGLNWLPIMPARESFLV